MHAWGHVDLPNGTVNGSVPSGDGYPSQGSSQPYPMLSHDRFPLHWQQCQDAAARQWQRARERDPIDRSPAPVRGLNRSCLRPDDGGSDPASGIHDSQSSAQIPAAPGSAGPSIPFRSPPASGQAWWENPSPHRQPLEMCFLQPQSTRKASLQSGSGTPKAVQQSARTSPRSITTEGSADLLAELGDPEHEKLYQGILVAHTAREQIINDILYFGRHLKRSNETEFLLQNVASPSEKRWLQKDLGYLPPSVLNLVVVRRSLMKVLLFATLVTSVALIMSTCKKMKTTAAEIKEEPMPYPFSQWKEYQEEHQQPADFGNYSKAVAVETHRMMKAQVGIVETLQMVVIGITTFVAAGLITRSLQLWEHFRRSRQLIIYAWMLTIAAPFFVSMVPVRLWVDMKAPAPLITSYKYDLDEYIQLNDKRERLREACQKIESGELQQTINTWTSRIETLCSLTRALPKWGSIKKMSDTCNEHQGTINEAMIKETVQKLDKNCKALATILREYHQGSGDSSEILHWGVDTLRMFAEGGTAIGLALQQLSTLFPKALSIGPAITRGAMRMKIVIPQSNLPGMILGSLPWLYVPMTWCMYLLFFQVIGSSLLLIGLTLLVAGPLVQIAAVQHYGLTLPMSGHEVIPAIRKVTRIASLATLFACTFIFCWFAHALWRHAEIHDFWGLLGTDEDLGWSTQKEMDFMNKALDAALVVEDWMGFTAGVIASIIKLVCTSMQSYFLTMLASMDLMIGQMVIFREVERAMEEDIAGHDVKQVSKQIQLEYFERMDQLVSLDTGLKWKLAHRKTKTSPGAPACRHLDDAE